jgi:spoIIIJ-associated protein
MISLITTEAEVSVQIHNEFVLYNISGGNSAVLIGKRGQTLEAMQYLVDKIVNKQSDQRIRIQIDVEGYMKSRRDNLKNLATRLAEKTKRTGKPSTISQMTAHDRRIVHLQLKDDKEVRTQSVGDGYYRRLIIFPKKGTARKKKQRTKAASASNNRQTSKEVKK